MRVSKSGLRQLQALLLGLSSELSSMSEGLAEQATKVNPDENDMINLLDNTLDEIPTTVKHYEEEFDKFFDRHVKFADIA